MNNTKSLGENEQDFASADRDACRRREEKGLEASKKLGEERIAGIEERGSNIELRRAKSEKKVSRGSIILSGIGDRIAGIIE